MPWPVELSVPKAIQGSQRFPCVSTPQSPSRIDAGASGIDILNGPLLGVLVPIFWMVGLALFRWVLLPFQVLAILHLLAVGYSRIESGEHWLFDALGGCLVAMLWLALFIFLYRWTTDLLATRRAGRAAKTRTTA